jgi:hypothetical protein
LGEKFIYTSLLNLIQLAKNLKDLRLEIDEIYDEKDIIAIYRELFYSKIINKRAIIN